MNSPVIRPVILCGGSGTRLWPLSRTHYPKQFLRLVDDFSLLQNTLRRLDGLVGARQDHRRGQRKPPLPGRRTVPRDRLQADILLEPAARNTAPAVAAAALQAISETGVASRSPAAGPSLRSRDRRRGGFSGAVRAAVPHAAAGALVTFGVLPDRPETGYGYIRRGDPLAGGYASTASSRSPIPETAQRLPRFRRVLLEQRHVPVPRRHLSRSARTFRARHSRVRCQGRHDGAARSRFPAPRSASFAASPSNSIDYAVMEKTDRGVVIPLAAGWNDIGAWDALASIGQADGNGNTQRGDVLRRHPQFRPGLGRQTCSPRSASAS
jgi:mannose-1-phosphate guanylyltransferase